MLEPAQTPASDAEQAPVAPAAAAPYVLPVQELQALAQAAGMQWVLSDPEKIAAAQAAIAAEPAPVHVPRERPAPVVLDEGPLILVETRKNLAELQLPFEASDTSAR